jgi:hypothetical protein
MCNASINRAVAQQYRGPITGVGACGGLLHVGSLLLLYYTDPAASAVTGWFEPQEWKPCQIVYVYTRLQGALLIAVCIPCPILYVPTLLLQGILSPRMFTMMILMAIITTCMTAPGEA